MPLKQLRGVCQIVCLSSKSFVNKNESPLGKFSLFILQGTGWVATLRHANWSFTSQRGIFGKIKDLQRHSAFSAPVFFLWRNNFHQWHNLHPPLPHVLPGWCWQNLTQGCLLLFFFFFFFQPVPTQLLRGELQHKWGRSCSLCLFPSSNVAHGGKTCSPSAHGCAKTRQESAQRYVLFLKKS